MEFLIEEIRDGSHYYDADENGEPFSDKKSAQRDIEIIKERDKRIGINQNVIFNIVQIVRE